MLLPRGTIGTSRQAVQIAYWRENTPEYVRERTEECRKHSTGDVFCVDETIRAFNELGIEPTEAAVAANTTRDYSTKMILERYPQIDAAVAKNPNIESRETRGASGVKLTHYRDVTAQKVKLRV